jgi:hypothetical protein
VERRLRLHRYQWIGVPLLLLGPPLLALLGVFGDRYETVSGAAGDIVVTVEYPARLRYRQRADITVALRAPENDSLRIRLDEGYARAFTDLEATPSFAEPYRLAVAGGTRRVVIELRAERYGRHDGALSVTTASGRTVSLPLATTIFP